MSRIQLSSIPFLLFQLLNKLVFWFHVYVWKLFLGRQVVFEVFCSTSSEFWLKQFYVYGKHLFSFSFYFFILFWGKASQKLKSSLFLIHSLHFSFKETKQVYALKTIFSLLEPNINEHKFCFLGKTNVLYIFFQQF